LVLGAVQVFRPPVKPGRPLAPADQPVEVTAIAGGSNISTGEISFVTNRFEWGQIASTNYEELAANLRAVGCPERTVRDIVLGEVWRAWDAFQHPEYDHQPFWLSGPRLAATQRKREAEEQRLQSELAGTMRKLFNDEWSPELPRDPIADDVMLSRLITGDVPEEKFERALGVLVALKQKKDTKSQRLLLDEDYAAIGLERDEAERTFLAMFSPAEFEEFRARVGMVQLITRSEALLELGLAPARLRQIALATSEVRPLGWNFLNLDEGESPEARQARDEKFEEVIHQNLGDDSFAQFEDSRYRTICKFARANGLAADTARKMDEIRKVAAEETRRLREDKSLETALREDALRTVSASVARAFKELLGANLYAEFLRQNNSWVTNHASL
jgi:hypothetical protein